MSSLYRILLLPLAAAISLTSLTSCYFNTAEHIFDAASHNAAISTGDIKSNDSVYKSSTGNYYVKVPRYRYDTEINTLSPLKERKSQKKEVSYSKGDYAIVQIPEDYAMVMTGQGAACIWPPELKPTNLESSFLSSCTAYSVSNPQTAVTKEYTYVSPNSGWLYLLGVFDWICVDLPVSCALSLTVGTVSFMGALSDANSGGGSSSGSSGGGTCGVCGGKGYTFGGSSGGPGAAPIQVGCSSCGGSGRR